ncbi:MAG: T9SS type A sorting domain-containing protein, partial [Bacteroidales bacterium]|nr:T9SS type A sorting domain-containing protein [Bacteroidales bacterium]
YKVIFVNDTVGYICGANGTVLKTENRGLTWNNIGISTALNLLSMSFINQDTGWISGGNGGYPYGLFGNKGILIKTCNGGKNWDIDTNFTSIISSVCFIDNDTGYIAENNKDSNSICKTTDGGISFNIILRDVYEGVFSYKDIVFSNAQTGYFLKSRNYDGIYKTDDYGLTWVPIVELFYPIFNMQIMDSCNLFYNYWDNTTGTSSLENTIIGIDYCTDTEFDNFGLEKYGFIYSYLQIFEFDFINLDEGFCIGEGEKGNRNNRIFILKKGYYDYITEFEKNSVVTLIPNPFNDKTTLLFTSSFDLMTLNIAVYNLVGQRINAGIQVNDNEVHIDLSREKSGVYIVSIKDKNKLIENCKLIKF